MALAHHSSVLAAGIALLFLAAPSPASAQARLFADRRYELSRRLRAFEKTWNGSRDKDARRRASAAMARAVQRFFSMRLRSAAAGIDEAHDALTPSSLDGAALARSLSFRPEAFFIDAAKTSLSLQIDRAYPVEDQRTLSLTLRLRPLQGGEAVLEQSAQVATLPTSASLDLGAVPAGDYRLEITVSSDAGELARHQLWLSRAARLDQRLEALNGGAEKVAGRTRAGLASLLRSFAKGDVPETDFPARALLQEAEALGEGPAPLTRPGQHWLWLPKGRSAQVTRVLAPEKARGKRPLVIALHGAGGSENLFFDGYGDGAAVKLCAERGWILAAPRLGMFGGRIDPQALIDGLAELYPVDRDQVFIVGHSMGAGALMGAVSSKPELFKAAAPISGGGAVPSSVSDAFKNLPFWLAAGETDFGRGGTVALRDRLKAAGVSTAELFLDPIAEHMLIVGEALPRAFAFFDRYAKGPAPTPRKRLY